MSDLLAHKNHKSFISRDNYVFFTKQNGRLMPSQRCGDHKRAHSEGRNQDSGDLLDSPRTTLFLHLRQQNVMNPLPDNVWPTYTTVEYVSREESLIAGFRDQCVH